MSDTGTTKWPTGQMRSTPSGARTVMAFDIGGTWFRSGVVADGEIASFRRQPAINFKREPDLDIAGLQQALVDYVIDTVDTMQRERRNEPLDLAGISMGAALNAHSGTILNAGPLWGPHSRPFDLAAALRARRPDVDWVIVNDVTGALLAEVEAVRATDQDLLRLALITISSGIAARTFDFRTNSVPVDRVQGLQGEIGHLAIDFEIHGRRMERLCECGGPNHLNAFCSGNGISSILPDVVDAEALSGSVLGELCAGEATGLTIGHLVDAVMRGDAYARSLLDAFTVPLAGTIVQMFTIDPHIERLVLTGGVVTSFGEHYRESVLSHLDRLGLYQITAHEPDFFRRRVTVSALDARANLFGAASVALKSVSRQRQMTADHGGRSTWTVAAELPMHYDVHECDDLLADGCWDLLFSENSSSSTSNRRFVVIDAEVDRLHGERIRGYFARSGIEAGYLVMASSEQRKTMAAVTEVADALSAFRLARRAEPVIVMGGGVLLDIVGLAAGLFRRNTPYIRVPTTLLAQVDASVGVKTGVNHGSHKNLLGLYKAPLATFIDRTFLHTLPQEQVRNGMAEMIKLGIIRDRNLFEILEQHGLELLRAKFQGTGEAVRAIRASITIMLEELAPNLWEQMLDRVVDFGHTFSPTLEMRSLPNGLAHGEAVAIDMALCAVMASRRGLLDPADCERVFRLLEALGFTLNHPLCTRDVLGQALEATVRHRDGQQRVPLPAGIGRAVFVNDIGADDLVEAAAYVKGRN